MGEDPTLQYWNKTWIDEINDELWKRNMILKSTPEQEGNRKTNNKTLMEYAIEYVKSTRKNKEALRQINYV